MKTPLWLKRAWYEMVGRNQARRHSLQDPGIFHSWVRISADEHKGKKIIRYAIYKDGRRVRGVKT